MATESPAAPVHAVPALEWTPARSAAGKHSPWLIAMVISIATFMEVLDTSIANVSLRHIAGSMAAGTDESTWVITSYLVANAAIMPISGWIADTFGRKRSYLICTVLFTIASLLCGLAGSLTALIVYRVLQGLAGGALVPLSQAMLMDSFPPKKHGQAMAFFGIAVVVAPTLGPPLGGWLTDNYGWRWVFFINVPMGILSVLLTMLLVDEPVALVKERAARWARGIRLDYVGFGLAALGLGCVEMMNSKGERLDWFDSHLVTAFAVVAAVSLVSLVVWEWQHPQPVVEVRLFRRSSFAISFLMMFAVGFVLYSSTTVLPLLLQGVHGYTAFTAGLVLMPGGVATFLFMQPTGIATKHIQLRFIMGFGLFMQGLALIHMSGFAPDLTYSQAAWARVLQGAFLGAMFIPASTLMYEGLPAGKSNAASAMVNIARNIGGSFGIAMANTILARRSQFHQTRLVEHVTPYDARTTSFIQSLENFFVSMGSDPVQASQQAVAALYQRVAVQAYLKAFCDLFLVLGIVSLGMLLLIPLLPRSKSGGMAAGH